MRKLHSVLLLLPALLPGLALSIGCALAAPDAEYTAGVKDYNAKNFKGASEHFDKAIRNGNKSATAWLYSANSFAAMGQYPRALQTYDVILKSFGNTPEATSATQAIDSIRKRQGMAPAASSATTPRVMPSGSTTGLMARIVVIPPQFGHAPVLPATIEAAREGVAALPADMRRRLDESDARIIIAPNMIDRWPESKKDLDENSPASNLAELPGRIYGKDMCIYERAKVRHSDALKDARPPIFTRLQVGNMGFQVVDDMLNISKDPALRKEWEADKQGITGSMATILATFIKEDDWGPRETCSELCGTMIGGRDENSDNLYRYFPRTKKWLAAKLGLK